MNHYVYKLIDPITNEFYFGARSCECLPENDDYMGSYLSWSPIDPDRLQKSVLQEFDSRQQANLFERDIISERIHDELNRNYHIPGVGFCMHGTTASEETKQKIRENHADVSGKNNPNYGKTWDEIYGEEAGVNLRERLNTRLRERPPMKGKTHSEETKKLIRERKLGTFHSEETKRKMSESAMGLIKTQEHRKNLSESLTGRTLSDEHKRKMAVARIGRTLSDEHKRNISEAGKRRWAEFRKKMESNR